MGELQKKACAITFLYLRLQSIVRITFKNLKKGKIQTRKVTGLAAILKLKLIDS